MKHRPKCYSPWTREGERKFARITESSLPGKKEHREKWRGLDQKGGIKKGRDSIQSSFSLFLLFFSFLTPKGLGKPTLWPTMVLDKVKYGLFAQFLKSDQTVVSNITWFCHVDSAQLNLPLSRPKSIGVWGFKLWPLNTKPLRLNVMLLQPFFLYFIIFDYLPFKWSSTARGKERKRCSEREGYWIVRREEEEEEGNWNSAYNILPRDLWVVQ